MKKINFRIQRNNNLNDIYVEDIAGPGNGRHKYSISTVKEPSTVLLYLQYQEGPRNEEGSICGILDQDLLEIVRHRLQCFQAGPYATRENAWALTHIEEALGWMNKRTEDRAERGVLGTMEK